MAETFLEVTKQMVDNNANIRKWGAQVLALADTDTDIPDKIFDDKTGKPIKLPDTFKVLGYITTDGVSLARSIESSDTTMVQDLEPVRTDMTGRNRTLHVTFGEMNAWVKALAHGLPVREWPTDRDGDFDYSDGEIADFPYYRLIALYQDGVGDDAVYAADIGYRVKVTDQGDVTKNRTDSEGEDTTFTFFKDPTVGKSYREASSRAKATTATTSTTGNK